MVFQNEEPRRGPEKMEGERGHSLRGHSTSKGWSWTGCWGMSCRAKEGQLKAGMGRAGRKGERSARAPQVPKGKVSGYKGQVLGGSRATMNQISQLTGRKE